MVKKRSRAMAAHHRLMSCLRRLCVSRPLQYEPNARPRTRVHGVVFRRRQMGALEENSWSKGMKRSKVTFGSGGYSDGTGIISGGHIIIQAPGDGREPYIIWSYNEAVNLA